MQSQPVVLLIDAQERLFQALENSSELLKVWKKVIQSFSLLNLPFVVTEQYPKGLGATLSELKTLLPKNTTVHEKESFSCLECLSQKDLDAYPSYVLMGLEAHICVYLTAKELLKEKKSVTVLVDAVASQKETDKNWALKELSKLGATILPFETYLFEHLKTYKHSEFKAIQKILKS